MKGERGSFLLGTRVKKGRGELYSDRKHKVLVRGTWEEGRARGEVPVRRCKKKKKEERKASFFEERRRKEWGSC